MIDNPLTPSTMSNLERYLTARLINLKNSLNDVDMVEQSGLYSSLYTTISEIQFALKVGRSEVVNNTRVESIILSEEAQNKSEII
jgi:hypothetical protein